jgi:hypothetical protein
MKKIVLLGLSVAANIALALMIAQRAPSPASHATSAASPALAGAVAAPASIESATWSNLTTGELADTATRLKTEGYPLSLQRAILAALIAERFADRHKAIADMVNAVPWWRGNLFGSADGAKVITARQALQREEKDALDQLLGTDAGTSDYTRAKQARANGDLPPGKASELNRIVSDYNELTNEVRNAAQYILLPEDRAKLALLETEKRADIMKLLSTDELFEYDLRSSPTAVQLRQTLAAFQPTDDEYRAIFRVQFPFDARYGPPDGMTPEQLQKRRAEQPEVVNQVKTVLTPERFAEYQLKTDNAYLQANALVTRLQLPATATAEIVAVQKDISKRADAVRADAALTQAQRAAQYQALAAEATQRLTPTIGQNGVSAYRQTSGGSWINSLQRAGVTPPPPKP